jgi:hypothetical protein
MEIRMHEEWAKVKGGRKWLASELAEFSSANFPKLACVWG